MALNFRDIFCYFSESSSHLASFSSSEFLISSIWVAHWPNIWKSSWPAFNCSMMLCFFCSSSLICAFLRYMPFHFWFLSFHKTVWCIYLLHPAWWLAFHLAVSISIAPIFRIWVLRNPIPSLREMTWSDLIMSFYFWDGDICSVREWVSSNQKMV